MYTETLELLIDGQWLAGGGRNTVPVTDPSTGEVVATLPCATRADLDAALAASARGFAAWKQTTAHERWTILFRAAELIEQRAPAIARTLTIENGKPLREALGEIGFCADATRWYAEEAKLAYGRTVPARAAGIRQTVTKEPVGPALGFAAWNFPAGNVVLKVAAALAAGCSIIVKPSEETPGTAVAMGRCFQDAGVPAGVLNIVFGVPAEVSSHLVASPIPKKLSLTGSTAVGKLLQRQAAETLKRCTMELGGHAPVLVFADANLEECLDRLVAAKFRNAGQVCTSPTRFLVQDSVYDAFVDGFARRAASLTLGSGLEDATQMGPLISERRLEAVSGLVGDAVARGAGLRLGGTRLNRPGHFFAPTILTDVPEDAEIMRQEPFGPVAPIRAFSNPEEAVAQANALPLGLAAYAFTTSARTAAWVSGALEAGVVGINHTAVHEAETPFGGVNESGYGSESGMEGLDAYLRTKFVTELH
jgi:succinate-semialdehyde dehydrogenase/glutarate-semialdehyde dehydrogenase